MRFVCGFLAHCLVIVLPAAASAQEKVIYNYDALGRFESVSHEGGPNAAVNQTLSYDAAGNRTNVTVTGAGLALVGTPGSDTLTGSALNDLLYGMQGQDTLTGGGGNDTFRYLAISDSPVGAMDQIADFGR
jgi:Ca2+-binding RTX toxin-like protein